MSRYPHSYPHRYLTPLIDRTYKRKHMRNSTKPAAKVRKDDIILIRGKWVRLARREKWNSTDVRLYLEDSGNGLPLEGSLSCPMVIRHLLVDATEEIPVQSSKETETGSVAVTADHILVVDGATGIRTSQQTSPVAFASMTVVGAGSVGIDLDDTGDES